MRFLTLPRFACLAFFMAVFAGSAPAQQSENFGISVVPAPGKVVIDGDLSDWDFSGRIWVFAEKSIRDRYSVEAAAMWDADFLYLAAKWKDPTPMFNTIDPAFNPTEGWKSDSWQLRFRTDKISHLTTWYFTPKKMPVLHVVYGKSLTQPFGGQGGFLVSKAKGTVLGRGVEMAYRRSADGKGFVQELKVPWAIVYDKVPEVKAGLVFQLGMEFLWGDPTGKTWPVHRYADNLQSGQSGREFFFTNYKAWGNAELLAKGHIAPREYPSHADRLSGTLPIRVTIPRKAARFTVAINDAKGRRVRNLAGDFFPDDYTVKTEGDRRTVEVLWDCLDDAGKLVEPGTYRVLGLTQEGLGADYEMCFYNPGTPPWQTKDGTGGWGADHASPSLVARSGDWMIAAWGFAEGGAGLIGIGPDGRRRWGEKRGASALAAEEKFVYAAVSGWSAKGELSRFSRTDGSYQPFQLGGKPRPFQLPIAEIFGDKAVGAVVSMAAGQGKLALALDSGKLALLDAASAQPLQTLDVARPSALAVSQDGKWFAVLDGQVHRVDFEARKTVKVPTPGLEKPRGLAVDDAGNLVVFDAGADSQVKAYSPQGKLVYTAGKKGGRPLRGRFDEQAMMRVSSVAVDSQGCIWVTENWEYPRRISVWGKDGKLVKDYVGNTGYAGTGCFLHDEDPTLGYVGPIEIKLDRKDRTWKVKQILWLPDPARGESFEVHPSNHIGAQIITTAVSGKKRSYLYSHERPQVIYQQRGDAWQPVAAVCLVGHISGKINRNGNLEEEPSGEFAGLHAFDGCFWNDTNRDGKVQRSECVIVPSPRPVPVGKRGNPGLPLGNGWGGRVGGDLSFLADGLVRYRPIGFTDDGAPMYGLKGMIELPLKERGDLVPVTEEKLLLNMSSTGYGRLSTLMGLDDTSAEVRWTYPCHYHGVHGSHNAVMPKPGMIIGGLKICGVARVNDQVGSVLLIRGNLGQDYVLTTDGLFVGSLFQDARLPNESLPAKEIPGMAMDGFTQGQEPFNGWFGRQADGKIRMTTGQPGQAAMILEVKGLESIQRFQGPTVTIDPPTLIKADQENTSRAIRTAQPKSYTIRKLARPPVIDGNANDWPRDHPVMTIKRDGTTNQGTVKLGYDEKNLYVLFDVVDATPMLNEGKDYTRLFKTGDAVDLQLGANPSAPAKRTNPAAGDLRLVFATLANKPAVILMKPVDPGAPSSAKVRYHSPVGEKRFDRVEVLAEAQVKIKTAGTRYVVEAALPLERLGLSPRSGQRLRGDAGLIFSDAQGTVNVARMYWSNQGTNLNSDEPLEAWLYPLTWGEFKFE